METVYLKVTSKVIDFTKKEPKGEQIAITSSFASLTEQFAQANKNNFLSIRLANAITLQLGDIGAIWRVHNKKNKKEFNSLYCFLKEQADQKFEFICSII